MLLHDKTQVMYKNVHMYKSCMSDQNNECKITLKVHGAIPVHDIKINSLIFETF